MYSIMITFISTYNLKIKHVVQPHPDIQYTAVLGVNWTPDDAPPFQLATSPGFHINRTPKGNLVQYTNLNRIILSGRATAHIVTARYCTYCCAKHTTVRCVGFMHSSGNHESFPPLCCVPLGGVWTDLSGRSSLIRRL